MLRLLVTHGQEEEVFAVPEGVANLGSARENDIVLSIPGISRRHALLGRQAGGVEVIDRGSKNGLLVEGQRVRRTVLTPGLRVQIGVAWLEVEEVSTTEEAFARLYENSFEQLGLSSPMTATVEPEGIPKSFSPDKAALDLAYHIAQAGVGLPRKRADLLLRIKATLGAEAFATLETTRFGRLRVWECTGTFSSGETKLFTALAGTTRTRTREQIMLKREVKTLLAGRDSWFLVARFPEEALAREMWRKEFLRFLASQFFTPVRSLDEVDASEVSRVYALAGRNARRTAKLLSLSPETVYKFLRRLGLVKRRARQGKRTLS